MKRISWIIACSLLFFVAVGQTERLGAAEPVKSERLPFPYDLLKAGLTAASAYAVLPERT